MKSPYTFPFTMKVKLDMLLFLPELPPKERLSYAAMQQLVQGYLDKAGEPAKALRLPKNATELYEHDGECKFVRLVVDSTPPPGVVKAPWDVTFYLMPLFERMKPIVEAFKPLGVEAQGQVLVGIALNEPAPGWFISSLGQFGSQAYFDFLPSLDGENIIEPAR